MRCAILLGMKNIGKVLAEFLVCILGLTGTALYGQTAYTGYHYSTTGVDPTITVPANGIVKCTAAVSADPVNYPPSCYIDGGVGPHHIAVGGDVTLPSGGVGTLFCQGAVPLRCTLYVYPAGTPQRGGLPAPTQDHTSGRNYKSLGGDGPCNLTGLTITPTSNPIEMGVPVTFVLNIPNFVGGMCIVSSDGEIDFGDGTWQHLPSTPTKPGDLCAPFPSNRIIFSESRVTHTYRTAETVKVQGWMDAQATNKHNGSLPRRTQDSYSNWKCRAARWDDYTIAASSIKAMNARGMCKSEKKKVPCSTLKKK